LLIFYIIF